VGVTVAAWAVTIGVIVVLLGLELLLATVRPHAVSYKEAAAWSVAYVAVAVVFGLVLADFAGWGYGSQYFAGYLVEKSLSVDNLFVFVIIMATFAVPREHQQRVLVFGIIAALVLRAVFIAVGAALLSALSFMFLVFGLLLVWTAVRLYRHRDEDPDVSGNGLVRVSRRILPVSDAVSLGQRWRPCWLSALTGFCRRALGLAHAVGERLGGQGLGMAAAGWCGLPPPPGGCWRAASPAAARSASCHHSPGTSRLVRLLP